MRAEDRDRIDSFNTKLKSFTFVLSTSAFWVYMRDSCSVK